MTRLRPLSPNRTRVDTRVKQDWAFECAKELNPGEWDLIAGPENAPHLVKQAYTNLSRTAAIVRRHAKPEIRAERGL